jgi:hypothetical protein
MIPRYQKILFFVLLALALGMGGLLWHLRQKAHERLLAGEDSAPTQAPAVAPTEQATLEVANDMDGSLVSEVQALPLPADPGQRARLILGRLLDLYAQPDAMHPVAGGAPGVAQVFLMTAPDAKDGSDPNAQMAVVNLTAAFAASHPSGLESEMLTVSSICATLHANLPHVTEVRFLVNGEQRANLAGHVDLTRTYLTTDSPITTGGSTQ